MSEIEQTDEGMRAQREHIKRLEAELRERDELLATVEAEKAQAAAAKRTESLSGVFQSLGLDAKSAALYPADADASADAVADWAQSFGIAPAPKAPTAPSGIDGLNRMASGSTSAPDAVDDLRSRVLNGVMEAYDKRTVPSDKEREEFAKDAREINRLHQAYAKEVTAGRAQPLAANGRGGPTDPPYWANRAQQAIDAGI